MTRHIGSPLPPPTEQEVREVLHKAGHTGSGAARVLILGQGGDRTVRRRIGGQSPIPYAAWGVLCEYAGLGII